MKSFLLKKQEEEVINNSPGEDGIWNCWDERDNPNQTNDSNRSFEAGHRVRVQRVADGQVPEADTVLLLPEDCDTTTWY